MGIYFSTHKRQMHPQFTPPDYSIIGYDQTLVIGGSGSGKSQITRRLVNDSIEQQETTMVIDPHGQLIDELIADLALRAPSERERLKRQLIAKLEQQIHAIP